MDLPNCPGRGMLDLPNCSGRGSRGRSHWGNRSQLTCYWESCTLVFETTCLGNLTASLTSWPAQKVIKVDAKVATYLQALNRKKQRRGIGNMPPCHQVMSGLEGLVQHELTMPCLESQQQFLLLMQWGCRKASGVTSWRLRASGLDSKASTQSEETLPLEMTNCRRSAE